MFQRNFPRDLVNSFKLGYADGNLNQHLSGIGFSENEILQSGLARQNETGSIYDYFRYQVIFPTMDKSGLVIHLKGKGIDRHGKSTKKTWQLKREPEKTPASFFNWNKTPVNDAPLYIVEGENDAVAIAKTGNTAWAAGGNISQKQLDLITITLNAGQNIVLVPDNDDAGLQMQEKFKNQFRKYTLPETLRQMILPSAGKMTCAKPPAIYKDVDDLLRNHKNNDHHSAATEKMRLNQALLPVDIAMQLSECLGLYNKWIVEHEIKYSANIVGQIIFDYLQEAGSFFLIDEDIFYIYQGNQYKVGNNLPFKSLLYQLGNINYADKQSNVIWESIQAQCYYKAPHTEHVGWIFTDHTDKTDPDTPAIYYNLCDKQNEIIKITPDGIEQLMNGCNINSVFLQKSPKSKPIKYKNMTDAEMVDGLTLFFDLFFDNMACDIIWKLYIICLIVNSVFLNMTKAHGINKFTGHQGSGKTETAGMITALLYGQNFVTIGSTASDYTDAALNPVTICDNLEIHNITPDRRDFLLCAATGITRQKRKGGTDSKNIYEKATTQIITTSIESFELPELIERAITISFGKEHFNSNYEGSIIIENQIIANRDFIMSSIFKLSSYILRNFYDKKTNIYQYLERTHGSHSKRRLNEHLACIYVILDEFMNFVPKAKKIFPMSTKAILDEWVKEQNIETSEIVQETNIIVRYLNLLADETANNNLNEYRIRNLATVEMDYANNLVFEVSTNQLLSVFELLAKKYNLKQRFTSVRHLSVRIRNENNVIESAGWTITQTRRIRGQNMFTVSNANDMFA